MANIRVYTDRSGLDGGAGAAAVLYRGSEAPKTLRFHISPLTVHTTFEAEALGLILGAHLISKERHLSSISISSDSQAALMVLLIHTPKLGQ